MFLAFLASFIMMTQAPPLNAALSATEAPRTLRAAFTVELQSQHASRVYSYDPRKERDARWQIVSWQGEDDELEEVAANWANEAAPDGRLFPDDLRASMGQQVQVQDMGHAWRVAFRHHPSTNDGEFDVWAAERLQASAWLDPVGERFLRIDYRLPHPVAGPEGGKLTRYEQSYFIRTEPRWGMSYVSSFSIDLEARAAFRTISRRYSANIVKTEFFFASAEAEADFEIGRMTIHMVKLCVGAEDIDDLVNWQKRLMKQGREPFHQTRMMPKQKDQLLEGGSIYWVIKGAIRVRQRIVEVREVMGDGHTMCELVFDPNLVRTYAKQKRPFQGWRYLKPADAPRDLGSKEAAVDIPPSLDAALKQAGVW